MNVDEIIKAFTDCHAIRISGKGYTPALFIKCRGSIYTYNKSICISGPMHRRDMTKDKLKEHLQNMINEGLKVEII